MAKKKMTKQEKKKAEAEQAEALRIEMEKERLAIKILVFGADLFDVFISDRDNWKRKGSGKSLNFKRQKSDRNARRKRIKYVAFSCMRVVNISEVSGEREMSCREFVQ